MYSDMRLIASFIFFFSFVIVVSAAEFVVSSDQGCALLMKGELIDGDSKKFEHAILAARLDGSNSNGELLNSHDMALCLDSPGGSYFEGRKIAQMVHDHAIPTRVLGGAECYSSCAVVFMAGRVKGDEIDNLARTLNVKGKLGFHAPYLLLGDEETLTGSEASAIFRVQNLLISDLIKFGSYASVFSYKPGFSSSLLQELYSMPPEELALVDNIDKAARWDIELEGVEYSRLLTERDAVQLCLNFQAWARDESAVDVDVNAIEPLTSGVTLERIVREFEGKPSEYLIVNNGGYSSRYCEIEIPRSPTQTQVICLKDDFTGRHLGDCSSGSGFWMPSYYALPANTKITDIK
jgi:hypothetical protein